jgi:hypothetical protein
MTGFIVDPGVNKAAKLIFFTDERGLSAGEKKPTLKGGRSLVL